MEVDAKVHFTLVKNSDESPSECKSMLEALLL